MALPQTVLRRTSEWIPQLSAMWHEEIPLKLHSRDFAEDGTHEWHPEFLAWITGKKRSSEHRARLGQAMRRLRNTSIREYEVAYRVIALGEDVAGVTRWLNDRCIRNGLDDRYTETDTQVIIVSAVEKLLTWY